MKTLRLFITLVAGTLAGATAARAQALDPTFTAPSVYAPGTVYSATEQADGKLVTVGSFSRINGTAVPRLVRFNANGTLDAAFNQQVGSNAVVYRARLLSNGQYMLVGFDNTPVQAGGLTRPGGLLRLNADGSGDTSFDAGSGPVAGEDNYTSLDDALPLANGQTLVVGRFARFSGAAANNLVRLNADGSVDATFRPGTGANDEVLTAVPVANGKVLIGGSFSEYNGFVCNGLARLNADGSFDTSFTSSLQSGSGVNNLAVQPSGRILVLGYLTTSAGSGSATTLVRLFDNGALDNSFAAPTTIATDFSTYSYYGDALVVQSDGKILVLPTPTRPLTRLNANGTLDLSYTSPAADPALPSYSLTLLRNGQVLAAGAFTSFAGTVDQPLVRVNTNGSLDAAFTPNIQLSGTISVVARQADGKLVTGGNFSEINGQPVRRLARFNSDGTLDAAFIFNTGNALNLTVSDLVLQPNGAVLATNGPTLYRYLPNGSRDNSFIAPNFSTPNFSGFVNRVLLQADGRILVGGNLNSNTGNLATSVARLSSNGSSDPTFALPPNAGPNGIVALYNMALQPDGKLLIGARFRSASGGSIATRLIRYTANGTIDPTFSSPILTSPSGSSLSTQLRALILQTDGKVLTAETVNTATGPVTVLSRLNPNGSLDAGFAPPAINGYVYSLAVQPNNRILVGGRFTSPTAPSQLARLLPDGNVDASFGPTAVPNGNVLSLLVQPDGNLVISGNFTSVGGQPIMALARLVAPSVLHVKAPAAVAEQTTAWPVPAHTQLHVALAPTAHAQQLELLDALGRPVRQQQLAGRQTSSLALEGLPAGIYLLRVTYAEGIVTRRVQVQ